MILRRRLLPLLSGEGAIFPSLSGEDKGGVSFILSPSQGETQKGFQLVETSPQPSPERRGRSISSHLRGRIKEGGSSAICHGERFFVAIPSQAIRHCEVPFGALASEAICHGEHFFVAIPSEAIRRCEVPFGALASEAICHGEHFFVAIPSEAIFFF
jgi:hypothetical protein